MTYTDPVQRALREAGLLKPEQPDTAPEGQIRYHLAVETTIMSGTATPTTVAAALRALADQIDPNPKEHHG